MKKVKFISIIICGVLAIFLTACQKEEKAVTLLDYDKLVPVEIDLPSNVDGMVISDAFAEKAIVYVDESEVDDVKKLGADYDFKAGTYALLMEHDIKTVVERSLDKSPRLKDIMKSKVVFKDYTVNNVGELAVKSLKDESGELESENFIVSKFLIDKHIRNKVGLIYVNKGRWRRSFKASQSYFSVHVEVVPENSANFMLANIDVKDFKHKDGYSEKYSEHYYDSDKYIMDKTIELYKNGKTMISEKITLSK